MEDAIAAVMTQLSPDPVIVSDLDSRIIDVNPATETLFGWRRDELIGHTVGERLYRSGERDAMSVLTADVRGGADQYLGTKLHNIYMAKDGQEIAGSVTMVRSEIDGQQVLVRFLHDERVGRELAELTQSERRFRKIMASSHELVSLVRPGGDWIYSALGGPLGFPPGYMPPAGILSLVHPDDYDAAERALDLLSAADPLGGTVGSVELRVRTVDGDYLWLENTGVNMLGDPDVAALVLQSRDVTARHEADEALAESNRQLKESSQQLQSVLAVFPAGVWLEDEHRRLVMVNQVQCDLFDIPSAPDDLVGIDCDTYVAAGRTRYGDGDAMLDRRRQVIEAGKPDLDVEVVLANGTIVLRDYVPLYSATQVRGHLWIYRDITERKQLERDQARARRQLEDQNQSLLELDHLKTELVATVSHELRTPLTSIISFAELLLDGEGIDPPDQRRFTEIIANNANRLLVVVGDLLLLGRAEAGNLRLQRTTLDVASMIDEVVAAQEPAADAQSIDLTVVSGPGPALWGDPDRLDQVLANLVSNAIKFTPPGGTVRVESRYAESSWRLLVIDDGIGIPEGDQAEIFERFKRASNATASAGTGLGLAVAKTLVEMHDGAISLHSVEERGTTVTVVLPCADAATETDR